MPMKRLIPILLAALLLAITLVPAVHGEPYSAAVGTRTPIKHVVNIFLENHSFDNLFGTYPYDRYSRNLSLSRNLTVPLNLLGDRNALSELSAVPTGTFTTKDPNEGYVQYHIDWNNGEMNGFLNGSGSQSLTYYGASQMGPEWTFAEQYGLADNYYAPQISESSPNHLFYLAGFSPVINDYGPPPYVPFSESIFGELSAYNISWGFYINDTHVAFPDWKYLYGANAYSSHLQSWNQFLNETASGKLPSVSYLFSQDSANSQGPPDNILNGEEWLLYVVDSIEKSPDWNTTAIFITYDEFGGYYDQVSPPVLDGIQLGFRVPLIVISPYATEDYISNTEMTHTSLLAFIDYNWNIPALNQLVSVSKIPLDFFDFNAVYDNGQILRSQMQFTSVLGFPVPETIHFLPVSNTSGYNFSSMFPMDLQIPIGDLPYTRVGSSNVTLSSLDSGIYITHDHAYVPFTESNEFYGILAVIQVAVAAGIFLVYRRGGIHGKK